MHMNICVTNSFAEIQLFRRKNDGDQCKDYENVIEEKAEKKTKISKQSVNGLVRFMAISRGKLTQKGEVCETKR